MSYYFCKMKKAGIYKIQSKLFPDKCYVGSSKNLKMRESDHFTRLKNNKHWNKLMQSHYNEFTNDLYFVIIETTNCIELLIDLEQYNIDKLKPIFNRATKAVRSEYDRLAAHSNQKKRCDNKSGYTGIVYDSKGTHWRARLKVNGKNKDAGRYQTKEDAVIGRNEYIIKHNLPHAIQTTIPIEIV
jgi:group I intron endonuclease